MHRAHHVIGARVGDGETNVQLARSLRYGDHADVIAGHDGE